MAYSTAGLNAAVNGVRTAGPYLALHTGDPGTTGAGEGAGVARVAAHWGAPAAGEADSAEVTFVIPAGGGVRDYTHFSVRTVQTPGAGDFLAGGPLDEAEQFSDNGGEYRFVGTLQATSAP
jgi:hypothetical protein